MLRIHFLNVGKGSCTVIEFPSGRIGVVDIDDSQSFAEEEVAAIAEMMNIELKYALALRKGGVSAATAVVEKAYSRQLTDPISYLRELGRTQVFRFILTHPDMDHMSGLGRLHRTSTLLNFWDTGNDKQMDEDEWAKSRWRKQDWECYQQLRQSTSDPKVLALYRGAKGKYYDEDRIEIWAPTEDLVQQANDSQDYNGLSYVLKVTYEGKSVVLGGDATKDVWADILDYYGEDELHADILLAPHHGSKHNFQKEAMEAMSPSYIVVSVATGTDYAYREYSNIGKVLSTKWYGNIVFEIDDLGEIAYCTQYAQ